MEARSDVLNPLALPTSSRCVRDEVAVTQSQVHAPSTSWARLRQLTLTMWRALLLPLLLLVLWEVVVRLGLVKAILMPSLVTVWSTLIAMLTTSELWQSLLGTLVRLALGFGTALVVGLLIGIGCALFRPVNLLVGVPLAAVRQVPLFGWIPLICLIAGMEERSKITFIFLAALYPIAFSVTQGLRNAPAELVEVGRSLGFGRWLIFRRVLFPSAVPAIFTGLKHGLTFAILAVVGAETFMTIGAGLGSLLDGAQRALRMDRVLVAVLFLGLLGFVLNYLVSLWERRALRWRRLGQSGAS